MHKALLDLQWDLAGHKVPVSGLLRKAELLAAKVGDEEFLAWARRELHGYARADEVAEYRCLPGAYCVLTVDGARVPIHSVQLPGPPRKLTVRHALPELESLLVPESDRVFLSAEIDPHLFPSLDLEPGDALEFEIPQMALNSLTTAVRRRIMLWTHQLGDVAGKA